MLTTYDFLDKQLATFEEVPFGPLDATAFSQMAMTIADGLIPPLDSNKSVHFRDLLRAEDFDTMFDSLDPVRTKRVLFALASSPRFRDVKVKYYNAKFSENPAIQFGAMTFVYKDMFTCIAFRGTDESLPGWKEDFEVSYAMPIPSHELGRQYVDAVGRKRSLPRSLYIVGHSKGGQIAEYAALTCTPSTQKRIKMVYELDSPGFKKDYFSKEDYAPIIDRMYKVIPQNSEVGLLMYSEVPMRVTHSDAKTGVSHNAYTWKINKELTDFVYTNKLDKSSEERSAVLHVWLSEMSDEERKELTDAIFWAMKKLGDKDIRPLFEGGYATLSIYLKAATKSDCKERAAVKDAARKLLKILSEC